jgi:glycosyltransferase involved in cell wall biosynthesis
MRKTGTQIFTLGVPSRTMEDKVPLSVVYLGRRGGGAKVTKLISEDLLASNLFSLAGIFIRKDNELGKEYDQSKVVTLFKGLASVRTLLRIIHYTVVPKKLLSDVRLSASGFCVVPMISPLGLIIESMLKIQGVTVIRLLHDFEKHPGDKWPPNFLIRSLIKRSKFLITLSNDVADKTKSINPEINVSVYPHPIFDFPTSEIDVIASKKFILFVGRIREYKGVDNLITAFDNLDLKGLELVIAGEGNLKIRTNPKLIVINRWLQENEISSLVKKSEAVVFPYIEASQSGLLPYCVSENKKVIVTPLPGLLEQTIGYKNTYVTKDFGVDSLSYALLTAVKSETYLTKNETPVSKNIEACLLESGLFIKK